jgi:CBS domain containing-hemolysin-like protein
VGQVLALDDLRLEVAEVRERRITSVLISRIDAEGDA